MSYKNSEDAKRWYQENRERIRLYQQMYSKEYIANLRKAVFILFGNKCAKCGFNDPRALQIDHINQCPVEEKKRLRGGHKLYRAILKGKRPIDDLQLLCANCNWIKRFDNNETKRSVA